MFQHPCYKDGLTPVRTNISIDLPNRTLMPNHTQFPRTLRRWDGHHFVFFAPTWSRLNFISDSGRSVGNLELGSARLRPRLCGCLPLGFGTTNNAKELRNLGQATTTGSDNSLVEQKNVSRYTQCSRFIDEPLLLCLYQRADMIISAAIIQPGMRSRYSTWKLKVLTKGQRTEQHQIPLQNAPHGRNRGSFRPYRCGVFSSSAQPNFCFDMCVCSS